MNIVDFKEIESINQIWYASGLDLSFWIQHILPLMIKNVTKVNGDITTEVDYLLTDGRFPFYGMFLAKLFNIKNVIFYDTPLHLKSIIKQNTHSCNVYFHDFPDIYDELSNERKMQKISEGTYGIDLLFNEFPKETEKVISVVADMSTFTYLESLVIRERLNYLVDNVTMINQRRAKYLSEFAGTRDYIGKPQIPSLNVMKYIVACQYGYKWPEVETSRRITKGPQAGGFTKIENFTSEPPFCLGVENLYIQQIY